MLRVVDLRVDIAGEPILHGVNLDVAEGEVVGVLGPSGAGKSTLLRAIAGLIEPASGDVSWEGESMIDVPTHKRGFGMMFQGYALFPHMTVSENVGFGLKMAHREEADPKINAALERVGLTGFETRSIEGLSGGERQRVALARTLAPEPRLVMLDEPLGALDRNLRQQLLAQTRRILVDGSVTALVVTHDRDEAEAISDRLAVMREGTIVQTGTLDEILASPVDDWVHEFLR